MSDKQEYQKQWLKQAGVLIEALPYMRRYAGKTFVIKYGGHAMGDSERAREFARDIVLLKQVGLNPVVVHGGGPQIAKMLDRLKIQSSFVDGLRVTDEATVEIVEMVLSGRINKEIVASINEAGGSAIGLSGKDGNLVQAKKVTRTRRDPDSNIEQVLDIGFVGDPDVVNAAFLQNLIRSDIIPVIAPIGFGADGATYNINADTMACAIAKAVKAERLLLLTDVSGVLGGDGELIENMTAPEAHRLIKDGVIHGGMVPKIESLLDAVEGGVSGAVIMDGRVPHAVLLEVFTEHGVGTILRREDI
ncbi:acetylglutamate kinase [Govanella unica]|uniref:Acetylglutamate kinase n=1 Tax=Govanella unica TaxID=2975056 RepID=A0A9X3Z686_9PROT|nr:acetylglutamate kinase [Govania unica]MDA5192945.1 acetylglutamate kinase [Govania unica]